MSNTEAAKELTELMARLNETEDLRRIDAAERAQQIEVLRDFVEDWIAAWNETWVDPEEVDHDWAELYQRAKSLAAPTLRVHTRERLIELMWEIEAAPGRTVFGSLWGIVEDLGGRNELAANFPQYAGEADHGS
jgi:hypothetical protein